MSAQDPKKPPPEWEAVNKKFNSLMESTKTKPFDNLAYFMDAYRTAGIDISKDKLWTASTDQIDKFTRFMYNNTPASIKSTEQKTQWIEIANDIRSTKKLSPLGGDNSMLIIGIVLLLLALGGGGYYFISKRKSSFAFGRRRR
jgi:hypothetical protein